MILLNDSALQIILLGVGCCKKVLVNGKYGAKMQLAADKNCR